MSIRCKILTLTNEMRKSIHSQLTIDITPKNNYYKGAKKFLTVYNIDNDNNVYLPYFYCRDKLKIYPKVKNEYPQTTIKFKGELTKEQRIIKTETVNLLNKQGCCILALYTGFGKTCLSLYIASKLSLKTLYINNRITIIEQLKESIEKFTYSKVQIIQPGNKLDKNCDFYIINAINVPKFKYEFFEDIGTLIVDEIHNMLSEVLSTSLFYINPKYLIGLSATPYRKDGLDVLFDLYFGTEKIIRTLNRYHKVYKIETPFVPKIETTIDGKLDWGTILNSQAENKERNEKIIKILKKYNDRVFIVICKRVSQIKYLEQRLLEENENISALYGNRKKYDKTSRIIIGTIQKLGTGFDNPRTNALLLATDIESYFIQTLGRSMRTPTVEPIIFDIVDKFPRLNKHWLTRKDVYLSHGGEISLLDWSSLSSSES